MLAPDTTVPDLGTQDWTLKSFEKSDFQDNFGNYWCDASFDGVGEPVKWVVKDPLDIKIGEKFYGKFTLETAKSGNKYLRFRREQKPEGESHVGHTRSNGGSSKNYQPRDDAAIRAQWAIGQSMSHFANKDSVKLPDVEKLAVALFEMADRVKEAASPKVEAPSLGLPSEKQQNDYLDAEAESLYASIAQSMGEEQINLDSIPF
jgi:hypothetical protein